IVYRLITTQIEGTDLIIPDEAYVGDDISKTELLALADTLTELESEGIDDVLELSGVDASYVSVDVLEILTESESKIVRRIVTKTLDNALDEATISVSDDAYDTNDDFTDEELDALIVALGILEVDSLDELFDKEPGDLNDIKNMDPKSYIIEAMFPGIYS
ncbi:MAG: hypothetical protein M0O92_05925, partial [Acholeplasmataceae bacterium]|nr:hypothetical protein [Acholeplasmataceae bacterium]